MRKNTGKTLKGKIYDAAGNEDGFKAAMYFGELIEKIDLTEDEYHHFKGLALSANMQYKQAIGEFLKVANEYDQYGDVLLWLGLEYSLCGDVDNLFRILKRIAFGLPVATVVMLINNVIVRDKRDSFEVFDDISERLNDLSDWDRSCKKIKIKPRHDLLSVIDSITTSIVNATSELYSFSYMRLANPDNEFNIQESDKYMRSVLVLRVAEVFLTPKKVRDQLKRDPLLGNYGLDEGGNYSICNVFYLNEQPPENALEDYNWKMLIRIYLNLYFALLPDDLDEKERNEIEIDRMWKSFKINHLFCAEVINANEDFLIKQCELDNMQALEVTGMYYALKSLAAIPTKIGEIQLKDDRLSKIITERYKRNLVFLLVNEKAKVAFEIAEFQMRSAFENDDFVWEDAGPISLSYFRILELEINRLVVQPLCNSKNFNKINDIYNEMLSKAEQKSKGALKKVKNKWEVVFKSMRKIQDPTNTVNGMELGPLLHLIELLRSPNDDMSILLRDLIRPIFNDTGNIALETGLLSQMISEEKREKYRNPPAHTRYLPLAVAVECREFVINSLIQLNKWIKENDTREAIYRCANSVFSSDKTSTGKLN